jgi:hypothetical protein
MATSSAVVGSSARRSLGPAASATAIITVDRSLAVCGDDDRRSSWAHHGESGRRPGAGLRCHSRAEPDMGIYAR